MCVCVTVAAADAFTHRVLLVVWMKFLRLMISMSMGWYILGAFSRRMQIEVYFICKLLLRVQSTGGFFVSSRFLSWRFCAWRLMKYLLHRWVQYKQAMGRRKKRNSLNQKRIQPSMYAIHLNWWNFLFIQTMALLSFWFTKRLTNGEKRTIAISIGVRKQYTEIWTKYRKNTAYRHMK